MPHRVNQWNYTDRGSATCHNDVYRGKSGRIYQASNMRSNQGFASVKTTFPMGSFATCRYPDEPSIQRTPAENTWHPQFPGVTEVPTAMPTVPYNTTGTKPLPIPFNKRPGYEEELKAEAEAKEAKYQAFKALRLTNTGGDIIPPDYHEHTIYSAVHAATEHHPGEIFRPSKERVGTTPAERAEAAKKLASTQAAAEREGRALAAEAERRRQIEQRLALQRQRGWAGEEQEQEEQWRPAAYDSQRAVRTGGQQPTYYNVPTRQTQQDIGRY